MAQRHGEMIAIRQSRAPALVAVAFLMSAVTAGLLPVLWKGATAGTGVLDSFVIRVLTFTLVQAGLSTLIALALGVPLARALARQTSFGGRRFVIRLLNVPLALPAIVAIIGIIEVYGAQGWLGGLFDIYGLQGILLAHVFFNFPLAARLALAELERIPPESWNLSAQLGFTPSDNWKLIEWPQLKRTLPGIALLIFLLCAASFAVVLTLGGGPRATTLEVAIYQALRADFDPQRASLLALVQMVLCAGLALLAQRWGGLTQVWPRLRLGSRRHDGGGLRARLSDAAVIIIGLFLLLPPLLALAITGAGQIHFSPILLRSFATSLGLGVASAIMAFGLAWPLAALAVRQPVWRRISGLAVLSAWIVPPAVMATGWFVTLIAYAGIGGVAAGLVITMNAMMALPFVFQTLSPAMAQSAEAHDRLCLSLGVRGWSRFRLIDLPALRRPIGLALVLALILSLGDLTAIALFGTQDFMTLPALIYRQMGSYRFDEAIGTALLLGIIVLTLSTLAERWSSGR